jgi:cancer susceptibility candidate protein 1
MMLTTVFISHLILHPLQWQRYLACDPLPELEDEAGINTFLTMWEMEKDWSDVDTLLEGIRVAEEFRKKVSTALESAGGQLVSIEMRKYLLKAVQRLEKILEEKVHKCIAEVFKCNEQFIDSESGNLCLERKTSDYTFCLWGNLSKNPRVKSFDFSNPAVTVDIPKPLLLADIVICLRIPATDPFSPQCRTYKCRSRPSSEDVVDVDEKKMEEEEEGGSKEDGPADQQEERTSQERVEGGQPAGLTQDTDKSSSLPQQESTQVCAQMDKHAVFQAFFVVCLCVDGRHMFGPLVGKAPAIPLPSTHTYTSATIVCVCPLPPTVPAPSRVTIFS